MSDPLTPIPASEPMPLPLPGLDAPSRGVGDLEKAIRRTLRQLHADGMVREVHAGKAQLAIELAQVIAAKRASGRASTIGNDARVLMEILDTFVPDDSEVDEAFQKAMEEWNEVMMNNERAATHATPEVRDTP